MKRFLSLALATMLSLGVLSGCGGDTQTNSDTQGQSEATQSANDEPTTESTDNDSTNSSGEKTTLTITFRDDGFVEDGSAWKWYKIASESYAKKDEVEINISPIQASEGDYFAKIALQLASDNPPDIVQEDTFQLPNDVAAGYLTDLTDYLKDYPEWTDGSYYESLKNGVTVDDRAYAIPYNTDTRGLWYNKDICEAAGLSRDWQPNNWEEIFTTLNTIKEKNPDIVPFWMNSGVATGEATSMQTYEMLLYATGGRLMDDAGEKWVVKSPEIIKALDYVDRIYKEELGPPLSLVLNGQASNTSAREYLPQGKLAVSLDGSWIVGNYNEEGASPWPEYGEALGFASFPTDEGQEPKTMTLAGGWGLAIPENSKNKEAAFDFMKHCMDPAVYTKAVINMGSITTRTDVAQSEEYSSIPFKLIATEFLQSAEFRPKNDQYSQVSTCIQEMVEAVASGNSTPQVAMEKYATDVARIVGDGNVVEK